MTNQIKGGGDPCKMCDGIGEGCTCFLLHSRTPAKAGEDGVEPEPEIETEFEVWQDDMMVASSTMLSDAQHYLSVYGQDGPARLVKAVTIRTRLAACPASRSRGDE